MKTLSIFNKIGIIVALLFVFLCVSNNSAVAQSSTEQTFTKKLTGKAWQSQSEYLNTFTEILDFSEFSVMIVYVDDLRSEGTEKYVTHNTVKFVETSENTFSIFEKKPFSKNLKETVYKVTWINDEEFTIVRDGQTKRYALRFSSKDVFSARYPNLFSEY